MNVRLLAAALAAGTVAALAAPAGAATRTITESYAVSLPVPFPITPAYVTVYEACWDGEEGLSRHTKVLTLPASGVLTAQVTFTGDWDLYLFDASGKLLTSAETNGIGSFFPTVEKLTWRKARKGQKVSLVACNWAGYKDGTVRYTFTYKK